MTYRLPLLCGLLIVCTSACHGPPTDDDAMPAAAPSATTASDAAQDASLTLSAAAQSRAGIDLAPASPAQYLPEIEGFAVVVGRETIVQAVSELGQARAAIKQSRASLARMRALAGTAGADSAESREGAERRLAADLAALQMADGRAAGTFGDRPPWLDRPQSGVLDAVAAGRSKLLRVTFPLGALQGAAPRRLRFARLAPDAADAVFQSRESWEAPADPGMPGRSYFALLEHADLGAGERLQAWATTTDAAAPLSGVIVPASAAVLGDDAYWCYIETQPGVFLKVALDTSRPTAGGYFVTHGIESGDRIVVAGAGILLAQSNSAGSAD